MKRLTEKHKLNISKGMVGKQNTLGKNHSEITKIRMSKARKGVKFSLIHKLRISKALKGVPKSPKHKSKISQTLKIKNLRPPINYLYGHKNPAWKGGISGWQHRIRTSAEYKLWRIKVFERDDYTCQWCGIKSGNGKAVILHADHIKQFAYHPELRLEVKNGRTLCIECHKKTSTYAGKVKNKDKNYEQNTKNHSQGEVLTCSTQ